MFFPSHPNSTGQTTPGIGKVQCDVNPDCGCDDDDSNNGQERANAPEDNFSDLSNEKVGQVYFNIT